MEEFISMVTEQLGIGEKEGRSATGGILDMLKEQLDDSTFGSIMEKLPGAEGLLGQADSGDDGGGGGLMGSLASVAGSLMGGEGGGLANIMKILSDSGISMDQATGFLSTLVGFLKDKLGSDLFDTVAKSLPDLLGGDD